MYSNRIAPSDPRVVAVNGAGCTVYDSESLHRLLYLPGQNLEERILSATFIDEHNLCAVTDRGNILTWSNK